MYETFYGFTENPFQLTPNPDYLYLSEMHQNALTYLEYGIMQKLGFFLLTGEIGTGKTTLIHYILRKFCSGLATAVISTTNVTPEQLVALILRKFGLPVRGKDKVQHLEILQKFLAQQFNADTRALLVIDEAQNLSEEALEELRMLSNLQRNDQILLQVFLVGQPELRSRLKSPRLAQLSQRISASYHLRALAREETQQYIAFRLQKANGIADLFTPQAIDLIFMHSTGIPRTINLLCDASLVYGFADELSLIDVASVKQAAHDKGGLGINYSTEYAKSVLSTPIIHEDNDDETFDRLGSIEERLAKIEKKIRGHHSALQQDKIFREKLVLRIKKLFQQERKQIGQLLGKYENLKKRINALGHPVNRPRKQERPALQRQKRSEKKGTVTIPPRTKTTVRS